jgi:phosphoribosylanthranilate isomerase
MFQIKICGITNETDAVAAVEVGADALGFNFYPKSPRCISHETAARILQVVPRRIIKVGLFVNESVEVVANTFDTLGLDLIQLHGDEPPEYLAQLSNRPVMKVFRLSSNSFAVIDVYLEKCSDLWRTNTNPVNEARQVGNLSCVLLDSQVKGVYGGSGVPADWDVCAKIALNPRVPPLVLAGGLTAENVASAIHQVEPVAVDTASGVETSPGHKDRSLMAAFVQNARKAFLSKDR